MIWGNGIPAIHPAINPVNIRNLPGRGIDARFASKAGILLRKISGCQYGLWRRNPPR
jgi:hypothetical protein